MRVQARYKFSTDAIRIFYVVITQYNSMICRARPRASMIRTAIRVEMQRRRIAQTTIRETLARWSCYSVVEWMHRRMD
jgi:hypothetical protein